MHNVSQFGHHTNIGLTNIFACQGHVCVMGKLTNILLDKQNFKCLPNNACSFRRGLCPLFNEQTFEVKYFACEAKYLSVWPPHKHVLDASKSSFFSFEKQTAGLASSMFGTHLACTEGLVVSLLKSRQTNKHYLVNI